MTTEAGTKAPYRRRVQTKPRVQVPHAKKSLKELLHTGRVSVECAGAKYEGKDRLPCRYIDRHDLLYTDGDNMYCYTCALLLCTEYCTHILTEYASSGGYPLERSLVNHMDYKKIAAKRLTSF